MKKILLLGANGQVGWELQRALAPLAELVVCDRQRGDLTDLDALQSLVRSERPDVIVNAAAYTAVDKAESDAAGARLINTEAVERLADVACELDAWLVHYSTDYVFDGQGDTPFAEDAPTAPLGIYGQTKRDGEMAIRNSGCRHLILRTSWVYATRGANFARTMLRLAGQREELRVVADQVGAPTSAELIADVTAHILGRLSTDAQLRENAAGTYHLVAGGEVSWHGFAQFLVSEALRLGAPLKATPDRILPISTAEYPLPARRPANSRLDTRKLQQTFGLVLPPWQFYATRTIQELIGQHS